MIVTGISKEDYKEWLKELKYNKEDYPKGNNVRYDSSYNPQIQLSIL